MTGEQRETLVLIAEEELFFCYWWNHQSGEVYVGHLKALYKVFPDRRPTGVVSSFALSLNRSVASIMLKLESQSPAVVSNSVVNLTVTLLTTRVAGASRLRSLDPDDVTLSLDAVYTSYLQILSTICVTIPVLCSIDSTLPTMQYPADAVRALYGVRDRIDRHVLSIAQSRTAIGIDPHAPSLYHSEEGLYLLLQEMKKLLYPVISAYRDMLPPAERARLAEIVATPGDILSPQEVRRSLRVLVAATSEDAIRNMLQETLGEGSATLEEVIQRR